MNFSFFKKFKQEFFFIVAIMLPFAFLAKPVEDDWDINVFVNTNGLFNFINNAYHHLSGRIFGLFINGIITWNLDIHFIWTFTFTIMFGHLFLLLMGKFCEIEVFERKIDRFLVVCLFLFGLQPFWGQCIYWLTGASYYLIGFYLLALTLCAKNIKLKCMLGFFLAITHEQFAILAIAYEGIELLKNRKNLKGYLLFILPLIIGLIIILTAPGVSERSGHYQRTNIFSSEIIHNTVMVLIEFLKASIKKMGLSFLAGFIIKSDDEFLRNEKFVKIIIFSFLGIFCVLPFILYPQALSTRVFLLPVFLMMVSMFWLGRLVSVQLHSAKLRKMILNQRLTLATVLISVFFIFLDIQACFQQYQFLNMRSRLILSAEKDADIVSACYEGKTAKSNYYVEIGQDIDHWINRAIAKYYGINSVQCKNTKQLNN